MIKIVVDSGCELPQEVKNDPDKFIEIAPLTLQIGDDIYIDDENLDVEKYIHAMESYPGVVKTAAPSPQSFIDRFGGRDNVFLVTISSKLSGSYNSAMTAKKLYMEESKERFVHVFDSLSTSGAMYQIANKILECSRSKLNNEEIITAVNGFIKDLKTYFILDRYDNLVKTGRIKPYIAQIASLLSLKPVCTANEGEIALAHRVRGSVKAINKLAQIICEEADDTENRVLAISHVKALEKALKLKELVAQKVRFKDIVIVECRGLCTTYAARGALILSFLGKPSTAQT